MGEEKVSLPEIDLSSFIKDVVWQAVIKFATQKLLGWLPAWLIGGPVGWIVGAVVAMVGSAVYDAMAEAFNLQMIVFKNEGLQREFDSSSLKLKLIARDKGIDSFEFRKARLENVEKLSRLVHIGA